MRTSSRKRSEASGCSPAMCSRSRRPACSWWSPRWARWSSESGGDHDGAAELVPGAVGAAVHHRRRRRADPAQRDRGVHVRRAHAQRGKPVVHRLLQAQRRPERPGPVVFRHGGGGGRGGGGPGHSRGHLPQAVVDQRRRRQPAQGVKVLNATVAITVAAVIELLGKDADARVAILRGYDWFVSGNLRVAFDLRLDPLSATLALVVTGVGALIHLYSIGYMAADGRRGTYFAWLNLFAAAMLTLVLAQNFLVMFLGWEGVGLCSYLLIGFWFTRPEVPAAAKKAFIANRIGDVGFLIAMFLIFATFRSLDFDQVFGRAGSVAGGTATAIALLLFLACTGKSAQIPLYVWLPDAMAGPTPVSALIHAATMVTAGVFLVARTHVLFEA